MSSTQLPLNSLAPTDTDVSVVTTAPKNNVMSNNFINLLLWFIIITAIVYLILYFLKPSFLLKPDSTVVDVSKTLITSIIIALIFIFILYLIRGCR